MNTENTTATDAVDEAIDAFEIDDPTTDIADEVLREELPEVDGEQEDLGEEPEPSIENNEDGETEALAEEPVGSQKSGSGSQKRINQLTRRMRDAERRADHSDRQFKAAMDKIQQLQPSQEQLDEGAKQGLTPEQTAQAIQNMASQAVKQGMATERFNSQVKALQSKVNEDGQGEALARLSDPSLTNFEKTAVQALTEAKYPSEIVKALNENEELFDRFSKLPDGVQRARLIDRLDGRIESSKTRKPKSDMQPTPKVRGAARKPAKDPDEMSQAEYEVYAEKQGWL